MIKEKYSFQKPNKSVFFVDSDWCRSKNQNGLQLENFQWRWRHFEMSDGDEDHLLGDGDQGGNQSETDEQQSEIPLHLR